MKFVKLEKRFLEELKKLGIREITEENVYDDVYLRLWDLDGYLGNLEERTPEIQEEFDTVYDFVNFWDDTEAAGDELDFEWINEQLKK